MTTTAGRGGAGAGAVAKAAAMALALFLAACSEKPADGPEAAPALGEPAAVSGPASGDAGSSGGQQAQQAQQAAAATNLDTSGWVLQPPFYAAGQEPYWRLEILDGWFVFRRSGLPEIEAPLVQPTKSGGGDEFDSTPLIISIRRGVCQTAEGQSGEYSAVVTFDDVKYDGCAYSGALSSAASAEAESVKGAVKVIDACLAKLGEPALVTSIYPREGGRTAAALRTKNRTLYECAAEPGGGEVAYLDEVDPGAIASHMTRMRFLRDGVAPDTSCADAEEVRDGDRLLGRLLTSKCRF